MNWKSVIGFEGYYSVSDTGEVKSIERVVNGKPGVKRIAKSVLLKPALSKDGYLMVGLSKDGKEYSINIHRLVAIAFIGEQVEAMQVNHIDGCKLNNHVSNLEWVTPKQNIKHAFDLGIRKVLHGGMAPRSKKVINTKTGEIYGSAIIAGESFGISGNNMRGKLNGKNKNTTPFIYLNQ